MVRNFLLVRFSTTYNETSSHHFQQLKNSCHTSIENRKKSHIRHFKCWPRPIPFSQCFPSNPGGHKHRYPLSVNPDWQVALFSQRELLSQAFWRRQKKNEMTKERWRDWMKEETKCRMIEYTKICINIHNCFYITLRQ